MELYKQGYLTILHYKETELFTRFASFCPFFFVFLFSFAVVFHD